MNDTDHTNNYDTPQRSALLAEDLKQKHDNHGYALGHIRRVSTSPSFPKPPVNMMNIVSPLSDQSFGSCGDVTVLPNGLSDLSLPP